MTDLTHLLGPTDTTALTARLSAAAEDEGLVDLSHRTVDSPVGRLLLVATEQGLVTVSWTDADEVLGRLAERIGSRVLPAGSRLDPAARQLDEYFDGRRRAFELPLDLRLSSGFRRSVLEHLREISYGRTESYTEVAAAAGSPRAVRAVGSACATNPLPVVIPCHRVLRSDGTLGGYAGGLDAKRALLALETA